MSRSTRNRQAAIEQRRQLHARIARSRRRLNQRASRLVDGGLLPLSWRQRIQDHPVVALATAAGAGMLLAQLFGKQGVASKAGEWLATWLAGGTWASLMKHLERFAGNGAHTVRDRPRSPNMPEKKEQPAHDPRPSWGAASKSVAEVAEMISLRWQLAELELRSDMAAARRLGVLGGAGLVATITSLPVLTVVLAGQADARLAAGFPWVTLAAGCLLLVGGLLSAWFGWRRFRGEFLGLRESVDECREDLIWLRDWAEERS